jgi:D-serine deaminase-like pyridoxal phosphate-dependent protein
MTLFELDTPCLILDQRKLKQNIDRLHQRLDRWPVRFRPHGKTAKSIDAVRMSFKDGFTGITVSTLKEARYYFEYGIRDMVYAVGIAPNKLDHVAQLTKSGVRLTLVLDSIEQARWVAARGRAEGIRLPALIEIDSDGHRSGLAPDDPEISTIGHLADQDPGIRIDGVLTHAGGSYDCKSVAEIRRVAEMERTAVLKSAQRLRREGLACPVVSVGSTPTAHFAESLQGVTEVRAGVFMFHDLVMAGLGVCNMEDIALSVLTSVIGHQKQKGWLITDAGWTALSRDRGTARQKTDQGYGRVCTAEGKPLADLCVLAVNQEHGMLANRSADSFDVGSVPIGTRMRILPNHACATAAMHERYCVSEGGTGISAIWNRINGW